MDGIRATHIECPDCSSPHLKVHAKAGFAVCKSCGRRFEIPRIRPRVETETRRVGPRKRTVQIIIGISVVFLIVAGIVTASLLAPEPEPAIDPRIYKTAGVYRAGEDIEPGDYVLYPSAAGQAGRVELRLTKEKAVSHSDFIGQREFYVRQHVSIETGQYIEIRDANLYKPERMSVKAPGEDGYPAAQFKVGTDIAAGEYLLCKAESTVFYLRTSTFFAGIEDINNASVRYNDSLEYRLYLTVEDGEYLYFSGRLYALEFAPPITRGEDKSYPPGQYKIGTDIPAGTYIPTDTGTETRSHRYQIVKGHNLATFPNYHYPGSLLEGNYTRDIQTLTLKPPPPNETHYLTLYNCKLTPQ